MCVCMRVCVYTLTRTDVACIGVIVLRFSVYFSLCRCVEVHVVRFPILHDEKGEGGAT